MLRNNIDTTVVVRVKHGPGITLVDLNKPILVFYMNHMHSPVTESQSAHL